MLTALDDLKKIQLLINGKWERGTDPMFDVLDKYKEESLFIAYAASVEQVNAAVAAANAAFRTGELEPYRRFEILSRAADLLQERQSTFIEAMVAETGFTLADNKGDFNRCIQTVRTSAEEAKRVRGEMVPLEGAPGHPGEIGFTVRVPLGVVAAITPFNSPLNTVAHKVAPALAAGNSVVLKPASYTPMSSVLLCQALMDAGLPAGWLNLVVGSGNTVGGALVANPHVRYFAFTGGEEAGRMIQAGAGLRRTQMELGNISATIICGDANLDVAVPKCVATAFRKAGQVCTSLQRLYVEAAVLDRFCDRLVERTKKLKVGDPRQSGTDIGPMISRRDAERAQAWVQEAVDQGAHSLLDIRREGPLMWPVILRDVKPEMRVMQEEIFAPVVSLVPFDRLDDAIDCVNATPYGLSAGIFTSNIDTALRAAKQVEVGLFNINGTSSNRADPMPYGGCKDSGFGREGPRYAIRDMTDERLITITPTE